MRRYAVLLMGVSALLAALSLFLGQSKVGAASPAQECSVPKEWGQLKGTLMDGLVFEDGKGTIRLVSLGANCKGGLADALLWLTASSDRRRSGSTGISRVPMPVREGRCRRISR
jgi:hypothetical protein